MNTTMTSKERKRLRDRISHLNLDPKELLVPGNSDKSGTLKESVHPYVRELLLSR